MARRASRAGGRCGVSGEAWCDTDSYLVMDVILERPQGPLLFCHRGRAFRLRTLHRRVSRVSWFLFFVSGVGSRCLLSSA